MSTITLTQTSTGLLDSFRNEKNQLSDSEKCNRLAAIVKAALIEGQAGARALEIANYELRELRRRIDEEVRFGRNALLVAGVAGGALIGATAGVGVATVGYFGGSSAVAGGAGAAAGGLAGGAAAGTVNHYRAKTTIANDAKFAQNLATLNEIETDSQNKNNNQTGCVLV